MNRPYLLACVTLAFLAACSHRKSVAPTESDAGVVIVPNQLRGCADLTSCDAACTHGSASDCLAAATTYATGEGIPKDETRAATLLENACTLQSGVGCTLAGRSYEFGHGVAIDLRKAFSFYDKACALEYAGGCYNLAVLLERGSGTPRDSLRALDLYRKVCAAGSQSACAAAERLESAK